MGRIRYNDDYEYEIFDDGYDIYFQGVCTVTQRKPYDKVLLPGGTYEENAIAQLDGITSPQPKQPTPLDYQNQADLEYLALMMDVELPSEMTPEEGE